MKQRFLTVFTATVWDCIIAVETSVKTPRLDIEINV